MILFWGGRVPEKRERECSKIKRWEERLNVPHLDAAENRPIAELKEYRPGSREYTTIKVCAEKVGREKGAK